MNKMIHKRFLALLLCMSLILASTAFAQEENTAVTRSDFILSAQLHADAYPATGDAHWADWETFLEKMTLRGTVDVQRFLSPISRVFFDGALTLNGADALPFVYDGYHSYRYIRSSALGGASMHFQMHNFFDFMMKPFYYMGLPTNYLALLMYPEASAYVIETYLDALSSVFSGEGSRKISYNQLFSLCESLNQIMTEDGDYARAYRFVNMIFAEFYTGDIACEKMSSFDVYLNTLDPEKKGMTITAEEGRETYVLGSTTIMERHFSPNEQTIALHFPDCDDYELSINFHTTQTDSTRNIEADFLLLELGEERLHVKMVANDLPTKDALSSDGNVTFTFAGNAWATPPMPISLDFHYDRNQAVLPYAVNLAIDWIHPQTALPAFTVNYQADMQDMPEDTLYDRPYDNQVDFFSLNEGFVDQYTERFKEPVVLSLLPFALEMPMGVIDDLFTFLESTSILAILGLE